MSVFQYVYDVLTRDDELKAMIATNPGDGSPAIFEEWFYDQTNFPYIVLNYRFIEGNHWAKREGTLTIDIFGNKDLTELEAIRNRVLFLLDRTTLVDDQPDRVRIYSRNDQPIQESDPDFKHWNLELYIVYWRSDFVDHLDE